MWKRSSFISFQLLLLMALFSQAAGTFIDPSRQQECSPTIITDDFEDGIIDPRLWYPIEDIDDPGMSVIEEDGKLHIVGQRMRTLEGTVRQSGLNSVFRLPTSGGFRVSIRFKAPLRNPGLMLEVHNTQVRYLTRIEYWGDFYRAHWGYPEKYGPILHEIGRIPQFGDESHRFHSLTIVHLGESLEIEAWAGGRRLGVAQLPEDLGEVMIRLFVESHPDPDWSGRTEYLLDDFFLAYGCPESDVQSEAVQDEDGDGIPNAEDYCPSLPGRPETNGC